MRLYIEGIVLLTMSQIHRILYLRVGSEGSRIGTSAIDLGVENINIKNRYDHV